MTNGRCVIECIDKVLDVIPINNEKLIREIVTFRDSLWNQSPEARRGRECWLPLQNILARNIVEFDESWKWTVLHTFNGNETYSSE